MNEIQELVDSRAWDAAFFSTFVLSLSFFESMYLRSLRKACCRDTWIMADVVGYRASLMEGRSPSVGHEYHLVPISLPKGIFHPKCVYLSSSDEDALAVGSGNLTFGGFGKNLEVVEIFGSNDHPEVFLDFANFLHSMQHRTDVTCPDHTALRRFEKLARRHTVTNQKTRSVQLLHSTSEPILDQIAIHLPKMASITVMSPYYDENGVAVQRLANALGTSAIAIAASPHVSSKSAFPFHKTKLWSQKVS